jgi:hypothetical protein
VFTRLRQFGITQHTPKKLVSLYWERRMIRSLSGHVGRYYVYPDILRYVHHIWDFNFVCVEHCESWNMNKFWQRSGMDMCAIEKFLFYFNILFHFISFHCIFISWLQMIFFSCELRLAIYMYLFCGFCFFFFSVYNQIERIWYCTFIKQNRISTIR